MFSKKIIGSHITVGDNMEETLNNLRIYLNPSIEGKIGKGHAYPVDPPPYEDQKENGEDWTGPFERKEEKE